MATHWKKLNDTGPSNEEEGLPSFDPYFNWATYTGFGFLGETQEIPVLLELRIPLQEFASFHWNTENDAQGYLRLSKMFSQPLPPLADARFCTAEVRAKFFEALRNKNTSLAKVIKRFELGVPIRGHKGTGDNESFRAAADGGGGTTRRSVTGGTQQQQAMAPVDDGSKPGNSSNAAGVVFMGVIDDGIAFAHSRLRNIYNNVPVTRIDAYWGQDLPASGIGGANPLAGYGWVLNKANIDYLLTTHTHAGNVDEDALYRQAGLRFDKPGHKSLAHRAGHGTHVIDLAYGQAPVQGNDAHVVAVKLPDTVTEQTSGATLVNYALDGIIFILWRALNSSKGKPPPPVVINMSYGMPSGPHDGTGTLEAAMDEVIRLCWQVWKWRVAIVLPSGNSHHARARAYFAVPPASAVEIVPPAMQWLVLPDDRTPSFLEVWLGCNAKQGEIEIKVTTPAGDSSGWMKEGEIWVWMPPNTANLCTVEYIGFGSLGSRRMALLSLFPTATIAADKFTAPAGSWRVELRNTGSALRWVEGRIRRDDSAFGYPIVGRQSRFEDPSYVRFDAFGLPLRHDPGPGYVKRASSINGIATGSRTIVVGGCRLTDLATAAYSGAGPAMRPQGCGPLTREGPDVMAPVERSVGCHGLLAAGTRSGSTVAMNGTSVAAPQIARFIADVMRNGGVGDRDDAHAEADAQETKRLPLVPPYRPRPPMSDGGYGRVVLRTAELPPANGKGPPQFP